MTRYASGRYHRASGTRNSFAAWGADLMAEGFPEPIVNSGDREQALQEQIFREAYDPSSGPGDVGPFNDRRFWPGHGWWKRVRGNATIAAPGASNHEKRRASDLAYPYDRDTPAHRRGQQLAKRHNITCEGMGFREWWHWTFWGPLGAIDGTGSGAGEAEDDMTPGEFLDTAIELVPGDPSTRRTVAQALRAIFTETEATIKRVDTARTQIADVAGAVWQHTLEHPLAKDAKGAPVRVPAADLLRYEPAEHENTRRMIGGLSAAVSPDVDYEKIAAEIMAAFPELDALAFAVAAADEADRRDRERLGS